MKSYTEYLTFDTEMPFQLVNITDRAHEHLRKSGIQEGFVLVSAMHITAGVFVNDQESGLHRDIEKWLEGLAPQGNYQHHRTGETNGAAHLKNLIVGHQVTVPVTEGRLDLGPWQQIFYAEFDGQRSKRLILKTLGF